MGWYYLRTMTKYFGFGALILYLKYEIVIRYLFLLLNGKVGVYFRMVMIEILFQTKML